MNKKSAILSILEVAPATTYDVAQEIGGTVSSTGAYLCMLAKRGVIKIGAKLPGSICNRPKNLWVLNGWEFDAPQPAKEGES